VRPRVFVSSVVKEFEEYREAARRGIIEAGGEPILVNEDFPALATSSRNACLDGVDSCDIHIIVIGPRGGSKAPSGKLVVEEEYEQARKSKKRILAFIQDVKRDDDAQRFASTVSDYVDGLFRRSFGSLAELQTQVANALTPLISHYGERRRAPMTIQEKLSERFEIPGTSRLRVVLAPEREEEVIDILKFDSEDFQRLLNEIGHRSGVDLLSYEYAKSATVQISSLVIVQSGGTGSRHSNRVVRLEVSGSGLISIDTNVTGRKNRGSLHGLAEGFVIVEADVIEGLQSSFAFISALYDSLDSYKRHQRFYYNVALGEISYRRLVAEFNERDSMTFANNENGVVPAFDTPRLITREDLARPEVEVGAIMTMLRRRLRQ
jgi:uncharacterized protein DUF4062